MKVKKTLAAIALLLMVGCATMADLEQGKGITLDVYGKTYDELWQLATTVISNYGLNIIQFREDQGYIQAARGMTLFSNGEAVAVYINPIDKEDQHWRIEVVSVKAIKTQIIAPDWAPLIRSKMIEILEG
jgi:hypothetical protein